MLLIGLVVAVPVPDSSVKPSVLATRQASECASGWVGLPGLTLTEDTAWCVSNCAVGFCPTDKCSCDGEAAAAVPAAAAAPAIAAVPVATEPAAAVPAVAAAPAAAAAPAPVVPAAAVPAAAVPAAAVPAAVPAAAVPVATAPVAAVPAVAAAPAAAAAPMEGAVPGDGVSSPPDNLMILSKDVKVYKETMKGDKTGDSNLPFDKLFIAYWGAGPFTPFEEEKGATMGDALKQGYNVIAMSFADRFQLDGSFGIDTDMCPYNKDHSLMPKGVDAKTGLQLPHEHQCMPSKANVSKAAGIPMDSWRYVLSFGGAAGPGPRMDEAGDVSQEDTFVEGFVKTYLDFKKDYGFDGIDIDVESSINSPVLRTFRKIYKALHEKGELISMAPETPSLNPGEFPVFQAGATNSYAPLVDTTIIDHVSWVAPQMYNDGIPFEGNAVKYIQSLQASSKLDWDGQELEIKIPASKIVLGFPATQAAAPVHALPEWETPEGLLALYRSSPELMATRGVMTWSAGHDYSSGWKWINVSDRHSNPEPTYMHMHMHMYM